MSKDVDVVLRGGPAAKLVVRARPLPCLGQRVDVLVDGECVASQDAEQDRLDLRIVIPRTDRSRHVQLRWAKIARLSDTDPREVAALVDYLDLVPVQPPTALHIPASLDIPGVDHTGLRADGWADRLVEVLLAGGPAAELMIRGEAPMADQELTVAVDDRTLFAGPVAPGPFALTIPVPEAAQDRNVKLRWENMVTLPPPDRRQVAARLNFIGVAVGAPPTTLRTFTAIDLATARAEGIHSDGWLDRYASLMLAAGPSAVLSLRADPVEPDNQHLELLVDGAVAWSDTVTESPTSLRVPLPAASAPRRVEMRWRSAKPLSAADPRNVAARLHMVAVVSARAPTVVQLPHDLSTPELAYGGIYQDGWTRQRAWLEVNGGAAADLTLRAFVPGTRARRAEIAANGDVVGSPRFAPGDNQLQVPLPPSETTRRIELCWETEEPLSASDHRRASARLTFVSLTPRAPESQG
jgi:hypothetical protein